MSSSDRSDGSESGRKTPTGAGAPSEAGKPEPTERSPRGRIIIRSSSHPPGGERAGDARDVSGARALPASDRAPAVDDRDEGAEARSKRSTPAERPRRRRKVQAEQDARQLHGATQSRTIGAERPQQFAGSRRSTPDRLAARRVRVRVRKIATGIAIAILLIAAFWALRR